MVRTARPRPESPKRRSTSAGAGIESVGIRPLANRFAVAQFAVARFVGMGIAAVGIAALWATPACSSAPAIQDPIAALAAAERDLQSGEPEPVAAALALLSAFDEERYSGEDQARYLLRLATAQGMNADPWGAYKTVREFPDRHGFSAYRPAVAQLEFDLGNRLIRGSDAWSFFGSDRERGVIVLEHFITRYPRNRAVPEALRLLGEAAFIAEDWLLSRERFTSIVTDHPDSEWVPLAKFKIAMARYRTLVGPSYDQQAMLDARNELRDFLALQVDNPQFRAEAEAALRTVSSWLGRKELEIARFYLTIDNDVGYRQHLRHAAEDYPDTAAGRQAAQTLASLPPALESTATPEAAGADTESGTAPNRANGR